MEASTQTAVEAAQTGFFSGLFVWHPGDKSLEVLATLYGSDYVQQLTGVEVVAGGDPTIITGMLGIVNVAIIALASIYIIYGMIFGIGRMTGDRARGELASDPFSSMTTVLRVTFGAGMLLPIASGLSLLQIFILWVITLGTGLANGIQAYAMERIVEEGAIIHQPARPSSKQFVGSMAQTFMCAEAVNRFIARDSSGALRSGWSAVLPQSHTINAAGVESKVILWGTKEYPALCGGYKEPMPYSLRASQSEFVAAASDESLEVFASNLRGHYRTALSDLVRLTQQVSISAMHNFVNGKSERAMASLMGSSLSSIALSYEIKTRAAVTKALTEDEVGQKLWGDFVANSRRDGWMYFGGWFYRISNLNHQVESIAATMPKAIAPDYSLLSATAQKNIEHFTLFAESALDRYGRGTDAGILAQRTVELAATSATGISVAEQVAIQIDDEVAATHTGTTIEEPAEAERNLFKGIAVTVGAAVGAAAVGAAMVALWPITITGAVIVGVSGAVIGGIGAAVAVDAESAVREAFAQFGNAITSSFMLDDRLSPIVQVKKLGDSIIGSVEVFLGALAAIVGFTLVGSGLTAAIKHIGKNVARSTVGSITGAGSGGGIVTSIMSTFTALGVIALLSVTLFGLVMSVYIPMVPVIIWVTAVMAWIAATVESIIAAPLWSVAHMQMRSDELVPQSAKQGYLILLNLFMRPALMVIAMVFAMAVSQLGIGIVNDLFFGSISAIQVTGVKTFITSAAMIFVYMTLVLSVMHTSYYLVHAIPDNVTRFIGGSPESLGQHFREGEKSSQQALVMIGNKAESGLQRGGAHGLKNSLMDKISSKKGDEK